MRTGRSAVLYRMVLPDQTCLHGVLAKQMLDQNCFEVEEHILRSRDEVDAFKSAEDVITTPQVFIDGKRIGGAVELRHYLVDNYDL